MTYYINLLLLMKLLDNQLKEVMAGPFGRLDTRHQVWLLAFVVSRGNLHHCLLCSIQTHLKSLIECTFTTPCHKHPCILQQPQATNSRRKVTPKITEKQFVPLNVHNPSPFGRQSYEHCMKKENMMLMHYEKPRAQSAGQTHKVSNAANNYYESKVLPRKHSVKPEPVRRSLNDQDKIPSIAYRQRNQKMLQQLQNIQKPNYDQKLRKRKKPSNPTPGLKDFIQTKKQQARQSYKDSFVEIHEGKRPTLLQQNRKKRSAVYEQDGEQQQSYLEAEKNSQKRKNKNKNKLSQSHYYYNRIIPEFSPYSGSDGEYYGPSKDKK